MPMASATCWLSATARIAMPLRDFRKNQPKAARKPGAISEYIRPRSTPLDSRRTVNGQSPTDGRLLHVLDADARLQRGLPAVLVGDRRRQLHLVAAPVGVGHRRVLLGHVPPAHL